MTDIFYHKITLANQLSLIELKINLDRRGGRSATTSPYNDYHS